MARGVVAPIHDVSLGFFNWIFLEKAPELGFPNCVPSLEYLRNPPSGFYDPHRHRSVCGVLQSVLKRYSALFPGWHISLMDSVPPGAVHSTSHLKNTMESGETPFSEYLNNWLNRQADTFDHGLISLAYISQLPAALEIACLLKRQGKKVSAGGSLPSALKNTGRGIHLLENCFEEVLFDDGRSLLDRPEPLLKEMSWPVFALNDNYLSSKPVLPFPLTTGCIWNRCLFCPDRSKPLYRVPEDNLARLLRDAPSSPVVHLIDSAVPVASVKNLLPVFSEMTEGFYGFFRPDGELVEENLMQSLKDAGCLMLQTGVESGSVEILKLYTKGFSPKTASSVVQSAHEAGIRNYIYLLFGLPGETDNHRNMTLKLVQKLNRSIDYMNLSVFNLPEICELADRAEEFGLIPGEYDSSSDVLRFYRPFTCSDGTDPRNEARKYLREVFKPDPLVTKILHNTPKWFRAGHMALMRQIDESSG